MKCVHGRIGCTAGGRRDPKSEFPEDAYRNFGHGQVALLPRGTNGVNNGAGVGRLGLTE